VICGGCIFSLAVVNSVNVESFLCLTRNEISMYLLFLDASGHSEFPPPYGRGKDTFYVLAGLAIKDSKWFESYTGLNEICREYFPAGWEGIEVHYGDLINKRGVWNRLADIQRKEFADKVFSLIKKIDPILFGIVINKVKHYEGYVHPETSKQLAVRFVVPRFSKFLQRNKDLGIMIYDSEAVTSDRPLRDFLTKGRLQGIVTAANWEFDPNAMFQTQNRLEGIVESILFHDSKSSSGLQLTDFCAYAIWSKFERGNDARFKEIHPLFDRVGNTIYGLLVWEPEPWKT